MPHVTHRIDTSPFTARHRCAVGVIAAFVAISCAVGTPRPAAAQNLGAPNDPFSSSPAARQATPAPVGGSQRPTAGLSEFATDEAVADIQVRGNSTIPSSRITGQMQTRVGRPFDPRALAADIKKLASLPYFVTVRPLHRSTEAGRVIVLEVVERRSLRYVEYLGNESLKDKKLEEATGLAVGGAVDPFGVVEGQRKIEALYREKGYGRVYVEVVEGSEATDQGVVYSINEGSKEKIWTTDFEGNTFASDGQLRNKIQSKPDRFTKYIGSFIGGKLNRDVLEADVKKLTSYYRSFGFFRARIGRSVELNDAGTWATVRFVINEGPRYSVRNVTLNGVETFDPESVQEPLQLTAGQQFEQSKMQVDLALLRDIYGSRGYVFADIQAETIFLEEPGFIDLVYNVKEGERWRIGKIQVKINGEASHTRIQTALNRLSIRPGQILDTSELRNSERRLGAASIFNVNPAQGSVPKITYQISEETKRRLAEREKAKDADRKGVFRGQSPATAKRYIARKPPGTSVYQVEQSQGSTPEEALFYSGTQYADPGPPENNRLGGYPAAGGAYPSTQYGGVAVGATDPSSAPIGQSGAPVQQLGVAPQAAPLGAVPTQYSAAPTQYPPAPTQYGAPPSYGSPGLAPPTYGQALPARPVGAGPPPVPVNTQVFPSQMYSPSVVRPPNDPFADIVVNLEETQTGRFMVGVAVNSDAGVVGQIMLDERNFDWRRFPRSFQDISDGTAWRGGGQRFRLEAAPGTQVQRYLASWQEPYLFDTPISLNLSGSYFDRRFDDWDEQRVGGRVGLGYQWVDHDLSGAFTFRGEEVTISNPATVAIPEYADVFGDNSLMGFGVRLVNDKRNNPFLATEGYYLSASLEQVIGTFQYGRAEIDARTYMLLRERPDHTGRHVMSFQSRLGFTGADTPIYDRFYAGGFSTLRGYDFRGASPQRFIGGTGVEIGGDFMFINSLEYLFPVTADDMVNGVVFIDHGTVNEEITLDNYRVAPGFGLRLTVPAMGPAPIALDFAFPVAGPDADDKRVFTFNVGLQR